MYIHIRLQSIEYIEMKLIEASHSHICHPHPPLSISQLKAEFKIKYTNGYLPDISKIQLKSPNQPSIPPTARPCPSSSARSNIDVIELQYNMLSTPKII